MEKSIRNTFKDGRNSTTSWLFCIHVRIQTQIHVFPTNSTCHIPLLISHWRNIKITSFIPAITGGHICSDTERALLALPVKFDGLGLQNLYEVANTELLNSKEITRGLFENVITENKDFQIDSEKTRNEEFHKWENE